MSFKLMNEHLVAAEGESSVRTYHCTKTFWSNGFLTITNKRVVFFASGSSCWGVGGNSTVYNEVPLADVATLALGRGTKFSMLMALLGWFLNPLPLLGVFFRDALPVTVKPVTVDAGLSFFAICAAALFFVVLSIRFFKNKWIQYGCASAVLGLFMPVTMNGGDVGWAAMSQHAFPFLNGVITVSACLYFIYSFFRFVQHEYLTLIVTSKGGMSAPIQVAGKFSRAYNTSAYSAYGMKPGPDAPLMFKELGAIITDIQTLGDQGVIKWTGQQTPDQTPDTTQPETCASDFHWKPVSALACLVLLVIGGTISVELIMARKEGSALSDMSNAIALRRQYEEIRNNLYANEAIWDSFEGADAWDALFSPIWGETHSNDYWVALMANKENALTAARSNRWDSAEKEWNAAYANLVPAAQAMRANRWVKRADAAIVNGDDEEALRCASNAISLFPSYTPARQRHVVAKAMRRHRHLLESAAAEGWLPAATGKEVEALLDQRRPIKWVEAKACVDKSKALSASGDWTGCANEWNKANALLQAVLLTLKWEVVEVAVRRGNYEQVLSLVESILAADSNHAGARTYKAMAESIVAANKAEAEFRKGLAEMLAEEMRGNQLDLHERKGFVEQLNRYGQEDWTRVEDLAARAEKQHAAMQGQAAAELWRQAAEQLPGTMRRMRAEKLVEKAEAEAKTNNWTQVLLFSDRALQEQPNHARAAELRKKADGIETVRYARERYQRLLQEAPGELTALGLSVPDKEALMPILAQYGAEAWGRVQHAVTKAEENETQGNAEASLSFWQQAIREFPIVVRDIRVGYWVARAEKSIQEKAWAKASIEAQKALQADPHHARAQALLAEADKNAK